MGAGCCKDEQSGNRLDSKHLQHNLVRSQRRDFHEIYDVEEVIAHGSISVISKVKKKKSAIGGSARASYVKNKTSRSSGNYDFTPENEVYYCLKEIDLTLVKQEYLDEMINEIELLRSLDHPSIIKAYETFRLKERMAVILQLATGGDLYGCLPCSEKSAARIIKQVCSAVQYLHSRNIIHRDIKFENICLEEENSDRVVLIDFGLAKAYMRKDEILNERVGTLYTMSPQVMQGVYTSQADMWSIGVVTYMILSGEKPFWGDTPKEVISEVMKAEVKFESKGWATRSAQSKDFIRKLLKLDPKERMTAKEALQHPWLSERTKLSDETPAESLVVGIEHNFVSYAETGDFKKLALNVIAKQSSTDEIMELRKVFNKYDTSSDGQLSLVEFKNALAETSYTQEEVEAIFRKLDVNQNGVIMYTEFLAATMESQGHIQERRIAEAFHQIDEDDTGAISRDNLKKLLGKNYKEADIDRVLRELDFDGDGIIKYSEFRRVFTAQYDKRIKELYEDAPKPKEQPAETLLSAATAVPGGIADVLKKTGGKVTAVVKDTGMQIRKIPMLNQS